MPADQPILSAETIAFLITIVFVFFSGSIVGVWFYSLFKGNPTTDDAYEHEHITRVEP